VVDVELHVACEENATDGGRSTERAFGQSHYPNHSGDCRKRGRLEAGPIRTRAGTMEIAKRL
jgi:hypothetical protein